MSRKTLGTTASFADSWPRFTYIDSRTAAPTSQHWFRHFVNCTNKGAALLKTAGTAPLVFVGAKSSPRHGSRAGVLRSQYCRLTGRISVCDSQAQGFHGHVLQLRQPAPHGVSLLDCAIELSETVNPINFPRSGQAVNGRSLPFVTTG